MKIKNVLLQALTLSLLPLSATAQKQVSIDWYGFVAAQSFTDTHASQAKAEGFQVAWSNQAFEFWFILHFHLYQGPLHRSKYAEMLTKLTGMPYSKKAGVASALYNLLFPKMDTAISHAKTILASFNEGTTPAKAESATTVFSLAEQLRVYM